MIFSFSIFLRCILYTSRSATHTAVHSCCTHRGVTATMTHTAAVYYTGTIHCTAVILPCAATQPRNPARVLDIKYIKFQKKMQTKN